MRHWGDQIRGLNKFIFQLLNITVNLKTHKSFAEQLYKLEWICRIVQCLIDWDIKQSQRTPSHLLNHPEIDPLPQLSIFSPSSFQKLLQGNSQVNANYLFVTYSQFVLKTESTNSCEGQEFIMPECNFLPASSPPDYLGHFSSTQL